MSEFTIPVPGQGTDQSKKIVTPKLPDILSNLMRRMFASINCISIGTIQSFNPTLQTARISINYKRIVGTNYQNYPLLVDCPVVVLSGGPGALTFPIAAGDTCLIFFNDRELDSWFASGQILPPASERAHDLSDGIALVGIRSQLNPIQSYESNGVHLYHGDDKTAKLSLEEAVKSALVHGDSKLTLIDGDSAKLESAAAEVEVAEKVKIAVGMATLKIALDALCTALTSWVDTGGDTPNPATVTAINAAKTLIDGVLE